MKFRYKVARIKRDTYSNDQTDWWSIVAAVSERDGYCCVDCGTNLVGKRREVHHIRPLTKGGRTVMTNLKLQCLDCHDKKHPHLSKQRKRRER